MLGLPKLFKEVDIHAEYPADVDDENIMENGFQSTLPGESTRLSSALALYRAARIMAKVLDEIYPAASSHEISLQKLASLNDELDAWLRSLPSHLRLQFAQDKPCTNLCGNRSPILVSDQPHPTALSLISIVARLSLHTDIDSPPCCRVQPWSQSRFFCCSSCSVKQAYSPDHPLTRGT